MYKIAIASTFAFTALSSIASADTQKEMVCHVTGSATNPFVIITIAEEAWINGHMPQGDFLLPAGASDCSGGSPFPN